MEKLVTIKIHFDKVNKGFSETLTFKPLGGNIYRVEETSFLQIVGFKDIIEAITKEDGSLEYVSIVEKSNFQIFTYLLSKRVIDSNQFKGLLNEVKENNGFWEIIFGGSVYIYLPTDSILDINKEMTKITDKSKIL